MDEFKRFLFGHVYLNDLLKDPNLIEFKTYNGNYFEFEFDKIINFREIESELYYLFDRTCKELGLDIDIYAQREKALFSSKIFPFYVSYTCIRNDGYSNVLLHKKYWSKFIDQMKYPVFIDNIRGMDESCIYWYQENRIVKKTALISKYLKNT